jgi:hypothetical protein
MGVLVCIRGGGLLERVQESVFAMLCNRATAFCVNYAGLLKNAYRGRTRGCPEEPPAAKWESSEKSGVRGGIDVESKRE